MSLVKPETNDDGQLPTGWHFANLLALRRVNLTAEFIALAEFYTSTYGPLLVSPKALTQNPFENLAGAALR